MKQCDLDLSTGHVLLIRQVNFLHCNTAPGRKWERTDCRKDSTRLPRPDANARRLAMCVMRLLLDCGRFSSLVLVPLCHALPEMVESSPAQVPDAVRPNLAKEATST